LRTKNAKFERKILAIKGKKSWKLLRGLQKKETKEEETEGNANGLLGSESGGPSNRWTPQKKE